MRQSPRDDDVEPDDDEDEWHDDDDADDGYVPCPYCGGTMLEAADHCPECDRWITREDLPQKRHPWWIIVVILILLGTMVLSVLPF